MKDHDVPFTEKDVTTDDAVLEEMIAVAGGHVGTPVLHIGDTVVKGFDREKITAALGV